MSFFECIGSFCFNWFEFSIKFNKMLLLEPRFVLMPSTRKQKAKEKRSRQSDVMSDLENIVVMLGVYPRNQLDEELEDENVEIDSSSNGPRLKKVQNCVDCRPLLNTICGNGNEFTDDTSRWISSEITNQETRKLDELKIDSNMHTIGSINSAKHETILPSLSSQSFLSGQNSRFGTNVDSSPLDIVGTPKEESIEMVKSRQIGVYGLSLNKFEAIDDFCGG